jgi:hypothetical protein
LKQSLQLERQAETKDKEVLGAAKADEAHQICPLLLVDHIST